MRPRVLILHANGTNRDQELAFAFELAGAQPVIIHLNQLRQWKERWQDYQILAIPGGFSYADTLGAGRLLALDLRTYFADEIQTFVASGKPVIGICNGFQALVKTGLLPDTSGPEHQATLTFNAQGRFECRWVTLQSSSQTCLWTRDLPEQIYCPVAHGEGRFVLNDPEQLTVLKNNDQIALTYVTATEQEYPNNPNGSIAEIAGICNPQGNVFGLMPHPEDHVLPYQHPRWTRGERGNMGLKLFENSVNYVK